MDSRERMKFYSYFPLTVLSGFIKFSNSSTISISNLLAFVFALITKREYFMLFRLVLGCSLYG